MKKNINFSTKEFVIEKPGGNLFLHSRNLDCVLEYMEDLVPKNKILNVIKHSSTEAIITLYDPLNLSNFYVQNWIIKLAPQRKEYFVSGTFIDHATTWTSSGVAYGSGGAISSSAFNSKPITSYGNVGYHSDFGDVAIGGDTTINGNIAIEGNLTVNGKIIVNGEEK